MQRTAMPRPIAPYRVLLPSVDAYSLRGLGTSSTTTASEIQQGAAIAVTAVTGSLAAVMAGTSLIIPLIGPALAGIALAINAILNSGCGQTCIETSQWANQAEPILAQNIQAYFKLPAPRSPSAQAYALSAFDQVWSGLVQRCSQQGLGTAGQNCISDRQAGACKWRQTLTSPLLSIPGEPQPGECWNWFSGYRDPIAMDTQVAAADTQALAANGQTATQALAGALTSSNGTFYLLAAVAVAVLAFGGDN